MLQVHPVPSTTGGMVVKLGGLCRVLLMSSHFPVVLEVIVNTASDTIELRSTVAVNEEVTKIIQQLINDFELHITYLSESLDNDLSLTDVDNQFTSGWPVHQLWTLAVQKSADPWIVGMIISELSILLCTPMENL